jgi:hypothetical protein
MYKINIMKKITSLLSFLVLFTAFTCDNEPLDTDIVNTESSSDTGSNTNSADLIGEWTLVDLEVDGTTSTEALGMSIDTDFTGHAANPDFNLVFTQTNYTTSGSYDYVMQTEVLGVTNTNIYSMDDISGTGSYTTNGNEITFSGQFMELTIDGVDESAFSNENQSVTFSITNNGNTLTIYQVVDTVESQSGATVTVDLDSTSIWNRVE